MRIQPISEGVAQFIQSLNMVNRASVSVKAGTEPGLIDVSWPLIEQFMANQSKIMTLLGPALDYSYRIVVSPNYVIQSFVKECRSQPVLYEFSSYLWDEVSFSELSIARSNATGNQLLKMEPFPFYSIAIVVEFQSLTKEEVNIRYHYLTATLTIAKDNSKWILILTLSNARLSEFLNCLATGAVIFIIACLWISLTNKRIARGLPDSAPLQVKTEAAPRKWKYIHSTEEFQELKRKGSDISSQADTSNVELRIDENT
jgi:hypothetical protein